MLEPARILEHSRKRHNYIFLEMTRSLCSICLRVIDAKILLQEARITMRKWRPEHGLEAVLLHSDAD